MTFYETQLSNSLIYTVSIITDSLIIANYKLFNKFKMILDYFILATLLNKVILYELFFK